MVLLSKGENMQTRRSTRGKGFSVFFSGLILVVSTLVVLQPAHAVPAFARQTGMACLSCHFQNFPALNSFGRAFRAGGYTMRGAQPLIEGDDLSLPENLNLSLITKIRYQQKGDVDGSRGEVQWPDEAALLVGGRAAENIGFLTEIALGPMEVTGENDPVTNEVEGETPGNFLSFKAHFNVTDSFAVIPFSTDALGAAYGFELLNTGAQRSQRPIENRSGMSAAQALGTDGAATGAAFIYHEGDFFVNYSHMSPTAGNVNASIFGGLGHYLRAAYMPMIGDWDTGFGVQSWSGTVKSGATDPADETHMDAWVLDAQAQGMLNDDLSLGVYASYGSAPKGSTAEPNHFNASTTDDKTSAAMAAKLGIGKWRPYLAYSSVDSAIKVKQTTIGFGYAAAQNISFEVYNVTSTAKAGGSDDKSKDYTMLMMFAGF